MTFGFRKCIKMLCVWCCLTNIYCLLFIKHVTCMHVMLLA